MTALAMCYAIVISVPLAALGLLAEHLAAVQLAARSRDERGQLPNEVATV
jgi:hypothetical protein